MRLSGVNTVDTHLAVVVSRFLGVEPDLPRGGGAEVKAFGESLQLLQLTGWELVGEGNV